MAASAAAGYFAATEIPEILLMQNGGMRIAFEGLAFPLEDLLAHIADHAPRLRLDGKLDCMDLEAWRLIRVKWQGGAMTRREGSLNAVLAHAGFGGA